VAELLAKPTKRARLQTPQILGRFLRGPVPNAWLKAAGACGLNALQVGLAIWHKSGVEHWALTISLTSTDVSRFGTIDRSAKLRALRRLEEAGLIETKRVGRNAVEVTILKAHGEE
jgi:hypothetical protein